MRAERVGIDRGTAAATIPGRGARHRFSRSQELWEQDRRGGATGRQVIAPTPFRAVSAGQLAPELHPMPHDAVDGVKLRCVIGRSDFCDPGVRKAVGLRLSGAHGVDLDRDDALPVKEPGKW
jgi:hypothetical protein